MNREVVRQGKLKLVVQGGLDHRQSMAAGLALLIGPGFRNDLIFADLLGNGEREPDRGGDRAGMGEAGGLGHRRLLYGNGGQPGRGAAPGLICGAISGKSEAGRHLTATTPRACQDRGHGGGVPSARRAV